MSHLFLFLLVFVPLVFFHELGHFLMAKLGGIHVSKFAFGFGKKVVGFHYKGTEYCWNLFPLGGYVDFMGEAIYTGEIPDDVRHFYNRPKWIRFLVLVMGPLFNLILALVILWFFYGFMRSTEWIPNDSADYTVGYIEEDSIEAQAGLQLFDHIIAYNGEPLTSSRAFQQELVFSPGKPMTLDIKRDGEPMQIVFNVDEDKKNGVGTYNFFQGRACQVQGVVEGSPAERAGLLEGDLIRSVNGDELLMIVTSEGVLEAVGKNKGESNLFQQHFVADYPNPTIFTVQRGDQLIDLSVQPEETEDGSYIAGFRYSREATRVDYTLTTAFPRAWEEFKDNSTILFAGLKRLIFGDIGIRAMSGPVGVAKAVKQAWDISPAFFIWLMAVLSINLGILNLLPIPVLDGGEIFVLGVEAITRKDFNIATKMQIKIVGLFFLVGLMAIVFVFDLLK